jgi:hypothetical protein
MFLKYKNIITNKLDIIFLAFIAYGIFEIFWTYYQTEHLYISIFRFRLWFFPFLLYFSFRYFLNEGVVTGILKTVKLIILISFLWTVGEFLLTSFGVVSPKTITAFLSKTILTPQIYTYGSFPEAYLIRGYGLMADVHFSGVFNVIGLIIFIPQILDRWNVKDKLFVLLGISGVIYSLSKTAWVLLFFVLLTMLLYQKNKRYLVIMLLVLAILEIYSLSFMYSATATPATATPATATPATATPATATPAIATPAIATPATATPLRGVVNILVESIMGTEGFFSSVGFIYKNYLSKYLLDSSLTEMFFGYGYYITFHEAELFHLNINPKYYGEYIHITLISLLRQFGIIGIILFTTTFILIPLRIYFKTGNLLGKGIALSVAVAGLSALNFDSIFRSGINVLVCFLLASLSVMHYESLDKKDIR